MQKILRDRFNKNFTKENYKDYLRSIEAISPGALDFRIAETPIFIPQDFTKKMLDACEDIIDIIIAPNFKTLTDRSIPDDVRVPGEEGHAQCMVFDFGICENAAGENEPQLIEMQGFPTLFAFQTFQSEIAAAYSDLPNN